MSFCLNCGNHKTCDCSGPPIGVNTDRDDTFGCPPPEARTHSEDSAGACEHGIHKGKNGYYYYRSEEDGTEWWIHPNVMESVKDSFGEPVRTLSEPMKVTQQPEARLHPCDKWVIAWAGAFFASGGQKYVVTDELKKAFNAGACHACREVRDVIPDTSSTTWFDAIDLKYVVEDIDAICAEWLG